MTARHNLLLHVVILYLERTQKKIVTNNFCLAEVGPKKILDLMNVPWLTRENVASHLQVMLYFHTSLLYLDYRERNMYTFFHSDEHLDS